MSLKGAATFGVGVACGIGIANYMQRRKNPILGILAEIVQHWGKLDQNGDGQVDRKEFQDAACRFFRGKWQLSEDQLGHLYDMLIQTRSRLDTNGDGHVSLDELIVGLKVAFAGLISSADSPGDYVIRNCAIVGPEMKISDTRLGHITEGTRVKIEEVVVCSESRRVRGRVKAPAGWISLLNMDNGFRWGERCPEAVSTIEDLRSALDKQPSASSEHGTLSIKVVKATKLANVGTGLMGDLSDPYCQISVGSEIAKTKTIKNNLNPEWNEQVEIKLNPHLNQSAEVVLEIFSYSYTSKGSPLGKLSQPLSKFKVGKPVIISETLEDGEGATLEAEISFKPAAVK